MTDFLKTKLSILSKSKQKFSNKKLLSILYEYKNADKLIYLYRHNFYIAIDFIEQIFKDILNKIHSLPSSIKKLCRIISELINQKFQNIDTINKHLYIAKFFFGKLIIPFLSNKTFFYNLNENSFHNLNNICYILKKYISFDLFTSDDSEFNLTPFNLYIIHNIENIVNLFQNITKIKLPLFIEKLINNKLPIEYEYDYFNENPDKNAYMQSILYNINQVKALITTFNNNKQILLYDNKNQNIKKIIDKLMLENNLNLLNKMIDKENEDFDKYKKRKNNKTEKIRESIIKNDKHKIHYYLFTKLKVNKKYEKLINIESREYFDIKNKKESKEKDDMIQIKNKLCYLLNKYKPLEISDFDENSIDSIQSILKEILSSLTLIENDDFIKLSAEYLFEKLKQFPDNYCQNLINQVEKDIKNQ